MLTGSCCPHFWGKGLMFLEHTTHLSGTCFKQSEDNKKGEIPPVSQPTGSCICTNTESASQHSSWRLWTLQGPCLPECWQNWLCRFLSACPRPPDMLQRPKPGIMGRPHGAPIAGEQMHTSLSPCVSRAWFYTPWPKNGLYIQTKRTKWDSNFSVNEVD